MTDTDANRKTIGNLNGLSIDLETNPSPADLKTLLDGLIRHSWAEDKPLDALPVCLFCRTDQGTILAGAEGRFYTHYKTYFLENLWVDNSLRRKGVGSRLMQELEKDLKARDTKMIYVDTFSFQALDFYLRFGYETFGTLDFPGDGSLKRHFLRKYL